MRRVKSPEALKAWRLAQDARALKARNAQADRELAAARRQIERELDERRGIQTIPPVDYPWNVRPGQVVPLGTW